MQDKTLRVVTYAAGASLAAITLIYVFGPTYFLDNDASTSSSNAFSGRRKAAVGLSNPANDCFINSVLQALAGLGDLRLYLIRELHRRDLDGESVYAHPVPIGVLPEDSLEHAHSRFCNDIPGWKLQGLQMGSVTRSLKEMLDALNERPIYKKTISAAPFVRTLEGAFRQRFNRQQQDAQEFLQIVAERLRDEYHAGRRARSFARRRALVHDGKDSREEPATPEAPSQEPLLSLSHAAGNGSVHNGHGHDESSQHPTDVDEGFPLEGEFESQIECLTCGFKPKPTTSRFCTLTLNVPLVSSTTLAACFDGMFKTEYIDDFKCEKCRLVHALGFAQSDLRRSTTDEAREKAQAVINRLQQLIDGDPENPPNDLPLPDIRHAPKRKIARHTQITKFPSVLAVHLSRSIFDVGRSSQKNLAKVEFPEDLRLGGLLQQRKYKLLSVVTHKGSHNSGHYESFRRQNLYPPFSNPSTFRAAEVYSGAGSPSLTPRSVTPSTQTPQAVAVSTTVDQPMNSDAGRLRDPLVAMSPESRTSLIGVAPNVDTTPSRNCSSEIVREKSGSRTLTPSSTAVLPLGTSPRDVSPQPHVHSLGPHQNLTPIITTQRSRAAKQKQRKQASRWWRISDDKIKEASTRDVLGMQREVYLLFYELERTQRC
jgi:ubiquitin carboxyl-terminal hydrolase 16